MSDSQSLRREIEEFDPFAQPANSIASLTLDDDEPEDDETPPQGTWRNRRGKARRAPSRDLSDALEKYAGHAIHEHATEDGTHYNGDPRFNVDDSHIIEWANALNVKFNHALWAWRRQREEKLSATEKRSAVNELAVYKTLQPLRHLIAIAHAPHKTEDGEIDEALEQLGAFADPDLRRVAADVALLADLASQLRELSTKTLAALFEIYKRQVDDHPMLRSYVVNWCRDAKQAGNECIYPPDADESEAA